MSWGDWADGANDYGRGEGEGHDWLGKPYTEPPKDDRRYVCSGCKKPLQLEYVRAVSRDWNHVTLTPTVVIVHQCPCRKSARLVRYPWDVPALKYLFGGQIPKMPWPHVEADVQPGEIGDFKGVPESYASPHDRREAVMERWAWDIEGTPTAHEFLLFCRGGRNGSDYSSS